MKKLKYLVAAAVAAFLVAAPLSACTAEKDKSEALGQFLPLPQHDNGGSVSAPEDNFGLAAPEPAKPQTVSYIMVTSNGVNIRSGAGTDYSVRGLAEKSTLYCFSGSNGGWYETGYRNRTGYISAKYCGIVDLETSGNAQIEAVIAEGAKLLGTPYVYGAVRFHDGNGKLLKGFTAGEFDCSSLMQYIFYKGADKLLQVNTRTQVLQGKEVEKDELKRGDLMFFTNSSRKNNKGIERIGHVALYLGGNYILHTASDFAKIEQISDLRWSYFVCARRVVC